MSDEMSDETSIDDDPGRRPGDPEYHRFGREIARRRIAEGETPLAGTPEQPTPISASGPDYHRFGREIVRRRLAANLTQEELADKTGVTPSQISRWENAQTSPVPEAVFAIEEALGLEKGGLSYLLGYLKAEPGDLEEYVMRDVSLTEDERAAMMALLRHYRHQARIRAVAEEVASEAKPRKAPPR